jgi:hypothetical protein
MTARSLLFSLTLLLLAGAAHAETRVRLEDNKPGPTIDKNIYGQFAEHLGRGIYGTEGSGSAKAQPSRTRAASATTSSQR